MAESVADPSRHNEDHPGGVTDHHTSSDTGPSHTPPPHADSPSISSVLILGIPTDCDEDDVRRSLEEIPDVAGVSRVNISCEEKRKYATATIKHHNTDSVREVEVAVGLRKPAIQLFTEECSAVFSINQLLLTDHSLINNITLQARKLGLSIDIKDGTVQVCGGCNDVSKYRNYLSTLTTHSMLHLPDLTNQIVAAQPHPPGLEAPNTIYSNFSPDVLLLMPKLRTIPGVKYYPEKGTVEFVTDNPDEREQMITAFQEAYQRIVQNSQFKSGTLELPPTASAECAVRLVNQYNDKYHQCYLSYDSTTHSVKIVALSSRQYDQARKLFKQEFKGKVHVLKLSGDRCVTIKKGNMVEEEADVIVNAANSKLQHHGGLAKALNEASSGSLQRNSDILIAKVGDVPTGEAAITAGGGKLKCKFVIHAVGPVAGQSTDSNTCQMLIYSAIMSSLRHAQTVNARSIVLPALSTGLYAVNPAISAQAIFHAINTFNYTDECLKDIRVVILDKPTYDCFVQQSKALAPSNDAHKLKRSLSDQSRMDTEGVSHDNDQPLSLGSVPNVSYPALPSDTSPTTTTTENTPSVPVIRTTVSSSTPSSSTGTTATLLTPSKLTNSSTKPLLPNSVTPTASSKSSTGTDKCPICLSKIDRPKKLKCCKQVFCTPCIDEALHHSALCPMCQTPQRPLRGNQPKGEMKYEVLHFPLPGYPRCGSIMITYNFPNGTQGDNHPSPGKPYTGTRRTAYLPDNEEGRHVLKLLRKAFDASLVFRIGRSITTGANNTVTWNDIHHKTNTNGGSTAYGYPDETYLKRVKEELKAKGIH